MAIHWASLWGHLDIVKHLLEQGSNVNEIDIGNLVSYIQITIIQYICTYSIASAFIIIEIICKQCISSFYRNIYLYSIELINLNIYLNMTMYFRPLYRRHDAFNACRF